MRVLHLHSGNLYGGVETMLSTLARHAPAGEDVRHAFALCFTGRLWDELGEAGAERFLLSPVRVSRPWTVWQARGRLKQLLREEVFHVAVTHNAWAHAVLGPVVRPARVPLAFLAHGVPDGRHWLERWARRTRPDLALANSRFTLQHLPRLFPDVPADVLYPPVSLTFSGPERAGIRQRVRDTLGTADGACVLVQVSRLEPWKGQAVLLRALQALGELPGWECWLVGGPQRPAEEEYLRQLRAFADDHRLSDRVRFLGQRRDVPDLLAAADVFCQPNVTAEPFGIVFLEALAAGLPVVTSALGGALEIVDDDCGVLVPPGDEQVLAAALGRLVRSAGERTALGEAGRDRARELWSPDATIREANRLLATLAAADRGPEHTPADERLSPLPRERHA